MKAKIEAMLKFSRLSTPEMYAIVAKAWHTVKVNEAQLQDYATKLNLIVNCATDSNINQAFKSLTGFYMSVSRLRFRHEGERTRLELLRCMRESIPYYYPIMNPVMTTGTAKFKCSLNGYRKAFNLVHLKEYQNGNHDFELNDGVFKLVHYVRTINENMNVERG